MSAVWIAVSNTALRPCCVSAEHSRYAAAFSAPAIFCPSAVDTGAFPSRASRAKTSGLPRRSDLVPTRIKGVVGQWCRISGYHFVLMLSKDDGLEGKGEGAVWGG